MSSNGTTMIDIASIAQWGPARHVNTRNGPRNVRKAVIIGGRSDFQDRTVIIGGRIETVIQEP